MVIFYYDMNKTSMVNYDVSTSTISFNHVQHEEEKEVSEPLVRFMCTSSSSLRCILCILELTALIFSAYLHVIVPCNRPSWKKNKKRKKQNPEVLALPSCFFSTLPVRHDFTRFYLEKY